MWYLDVWVLGMQTHAMPVSWQQEMVGGTSASIPHWSEVSAPYNYRACHTPRSAWDDCVPPHHPEGEIKLDTQARNGGKYL